MAGQEAAAADAEFSIALDGWNAPQSILCRAISRKKRGDKVVVHGLRGKPHQRSGPMWPQTYSTTSTMPPDPWAPPLVVAVSKPRGPT
jgi:hypothetical protein